MTFSSNCWMNLCSGGFIFLSNFIKFCGIAVGFHCRGLRDFLYFQGLNPRSLIKELRYLQLMLVLIISNGT